MERLLEDTVSTNDGDSVFTGTMVSRKSAYVPKKNKSRARVYKDKVKKERKRILTLSNC